MGTHETAHARTLLLSPGEPNPAWGEIAPAAEIVADCEALEAALAAGPSAHVAVDPSASPELASRALALALRHGASFSAPGGEPGLAALAVPSRLRQELARTRAEHEQFANIAAHDLQEPLRTVSGYSQLLARRYKGRLDADADEFVGFLLDGARNLERLVQDLLQYSRVGSRPPEWRRGNAEMGLLVALSDLRPVIESTGAVIVSGELPDIVADHRRLGQLFRVVLANALEYRSAEPPRIEVEVARQQDGWRFSVRDNGIGIHAQHLESIFEPFRRLHSRSEHPGSGLGLAIARRIAEQHAGRIWAESTPGAGSTFHFTVSDAIPGADQPAQGA